MKKVIHFQNDLFCLTLSPVLTGLFCYLLRKDTLAKCFQSSLFIITTHNERHIAVISVRDHSYRNIF